MRDDREGNSEAGTNGDKRGQKMAPPALGKRGEGWVALQVVLFILILFAPRPVDLSFPLPIRLIGLVVLVAGGLFGALGLVCLGKNLTPFPRPIPGGRLVADCVYRFVRHPIYTGLIFATFGWSLWRESTLGILLAVLLFLFFDRKSRREEIWLVEAYPEYVEYRKRVRQLIPWLY